MCVIKYREGASDKIWLEVVNFSRRKKSFMNAEVTYVN